MLALSVYELNVFAKKRTLADAEHEKVANSLFQKPLEIAAPAPLEHENCKGIFKYLQCPIG